MKRQFTLMLVLMAASISALAGTPVRATELPKEIKSFVAKHFPGDRIREAEKDREFGGFEYEIKMESGAEIDFATDYNWKEVKAAHRSAVPKALIPSGIRKYVSKNHPETEIVEISRKRGGYEIELSNGLEIKITAQGKVISYD